MELEQRISCLAVGLDRGYEAEWLMVDRCSGLMMKNSIVDTMGRRLACHHSPWSVVCDYFVQYCTVPTYSNMPLVIPP